MVAGAEEEEALLILAGDDGLKGVGPDLIGGLGRGVVGVGEEGPAGGGRDRVGALAVSLAGEGQPVLGVH